MVINNMPGRLVTASVLAIVCGLLVSTAAAAPRRRRGDDTRRYRQYMEKQIKELEQRVKATDEQIKVGQQKLSEAEKEVKPFKDAVDSAEKRVATARQGVGDARARLLEAQRTLAQVRTRLIAQADSSGQGQALTTELDRARTRLARVEKPLLAKLSAQPLYQSAVNLAEQVRTSLNTLRQTGGTPQQIADAANQLLQAEKDVAQRRQEALGADAGYQKAKAQVDQAEAKLAAVRQASELKLASDSEYASAEAAVKRAQDIYTVAQRQASEAGSALAKARGDFSRSLTEGKRIAALVDSLEGGKAQIQRQIKDRQDKIKKAARGNRRR